MHAPDLGQLFNHYGTDKDRIGCTSVFRALFDRRRDEKLNILEIGIGTLLPGVHSSMFGFALDGYRPGGSLRAWRDYFRHGQIYGVDIQQDTQFVDERIATLLCDSTDARQVESLFEKLHGVMFDLIIDDGSHIDENQLATLGNFYAHLARGGYYVIEDVHLDSSMMRDPALLQPLCQGDPFFFTRLPGTTMCVIFKRLV